MTQTPFDSTDRAILQELQRDGRIKNQLLADRVGLSAAACWRRVKALEDAGVIRGYTALLDPVKMDQGLCVLVTVSLTRHGVDIGQTFEAAVSGWPEVVQCYAVTGSADYQLRVVVPDIASYDTFLNTRLFTLDGVAQVHSNFALREVKNLPGLPL
ncbi:Lrp/AsnC family transcriptional regulator [Pokkaliibacter sp. CJK22405]|uniref:Lrp/AsnC family transcriptional regulator n=1 Tax=Pokkaliibacter sp. CJK22405 TaxID=3384615 RepID=UPI003984A464